jgi:anti-sigma regulatory factor (Ser/Thr protein kinase)
VETIVLAIGEAATNVVEHAYGPDGGEVRVRAHQNGSTVEITVEDDGRWRSPRGENRGRGTMIMQACCDELHVDRAAGGTTVRMAKQLGGARDDL